MAEGGSLAHQKCNNKFITKTSEYFVLDTT